MKRGLMPTAITYVHTLHLRGSLSKLTIPTNLLYPLYQQHYLIFVLPQTRSAYNAKPPSLTIVGPFPVKATVKLCIFQIQQKPVNTKQLISHHPPSADIAIVLP